VMKALVLCFAIVLAFLALAASAIPKGFVPTPFGLRPKQCVHRSVGNNVLLKPTKEGVQVVHANGTLLNFLPALPECIAWEEKMRAGREMRRNGTRVGFSPLDGWLDNAGYYPPSLVGTFQGNYLVPPSPYDGSQVLFYFIGTENFQTGVGVTILQPVLTWGNGIDGWSMASWNCCPSGQSHESNPITGFGSGNTLYGQIVNPNNGNWNVVSGFGSQQTVLTVADAGRTFDWTDVTLETYSVASCNEFPNGPMVFSSMSMTLQGGGQVTPSWSPTGATECNGQMTVNSPSTITISHN